MDAMTRYATFRSVLGQASSMIDTGFPEHEKLEFIYRIEPFLDDFLFWLEQVKGMRLGVFQESGFIPVAYSPIALLREFAGIDEEKLLAESERKLRCLGVNASAR